MWDENRHPPKPPRHHDGHAVTHSLSLCHVMGGQEGAPLCVCKDGLDRLPIVKRRSVMNRSPPTLLDIGERKFHVAEMRKQQSRPSKSDARRKRTVKSVARETLVTQQRLS